jgi:hypothetical protein
MLTFFRNILSVSEYTPLEKSSFTVSSVLSCRAETDKSYSQLQNTDIYLQDRLTTSGSEAVITSESATFYERSTAVATTGRHLLLLLPTFRYVVKSKIIPLGLFFI